MTTRTHASLKTELDAFREGWTRRVGAETATLVAQDIENLRQSGLLDRVARIGSPIPALRLPIAAGDPVDLRALAESAPLVIVFYRGGWCPYCNLELRSYQKRLADFASRGATLVAVSPETPDDTLDTAEKNGLAFPVLSDVAGRLADALGTRFRLSPEIEALYRQFGHDLPARNGDGEWSLPVPATFVVERGGTIAAAFVDPDYRHRFDPADALTVLAQLPSAAPLPSDEIRRPHGFR